MEGLLAPEVKMTKTVINKITNNDAINDGGTEERQEDENDHQHYELLISCLEDQYVILLHLPPSRGCYAYNVYVCVQAQRLLLKTCTFSSGFFPCICGRGTSQSAFGQDISA